MQSTVQNELLPQINQMTTEYQSLASTPDEMALLHNAQTVSQSIAPVAQTPPLTLQKQSRFSNEQTTGTIVYCIYVTLTFLHMTAFSFITNTSELPSTYSVVVIVCGYMTVTTV